MKYHLIVVKTEDSANWTGHELASLLSDVCVDDPIKNSIGFDLTESDLLNTVGMYTEDL